MINIIFRLCKRRYVAFLLLAVISFSVLGELYHFLILSNIKSMSISLNYPGAEQGLNPDGSRFNISEMTNDEILDEAKSELAMRELTNEQIKSRLFITTKFSQKAMENVISDIRDGMQGSYVPTTYHVYYSQKDKLAGNETYEFLLALAESYKKYFTGNHAENNSVLEFKRSDYDFSGFDYSEIYTVLYNRAEEMMTLVQKHRSENRGFRTEDNLNFDTVWDELENFKEVRLENFFAYVVQNNISKDRSEFMNKLSYLVDKNMINYRKKSMSSDITKNALYKYDPNITAVAFIPSMDSSNSYYMSRTKTGIDDLARNSYTAGMDAARISKRLDEYNSRYDKLAAAADTGAQTLGYADGYLEEILGDFEKLSERISDFDNKYLEYKTEKYFSYKIANKSKLISVSTIIRFAVLGFIFAFLIVIYMEFAHDAIHRKTKSVGRALKIMSKIKSEEE